MKHPSSSLLSVIAFALGMLATSINPVQAAVYQINCGGCAISPFAADNYFANGSGSSTTSTISTTGVTNAAPMAVYQTERYSNFSYTFPSLTAGASYTVRLHFAEIYFTASGKRTFNVKINGVQKLTNFDVYSAAGGAKKAVIRDFTTAANASGQIVIQFISVINNAKCSGIEIIAQGSSVIPPAITTPPANQSVIVGQPATFSVVATGTAPLNYQWFRNSAAICCDATSSSYTIPATTPADNGSLFSCTVSNGAGNVTSSIATLTVTSGPIPARPVFGAMVDVDGNWYHTIVLGNQEWTLENIRTATLNDGTAIPNIHDDASWAGLSEPAFCFYNNTTDPAEQKKNGALYNWYTIATGKLAPPPQAGTPAATDWHVPSDADWSNLEIYLIANGYNYDGTTTGNKIAKSMVTGKWDFNAYPGTIGSDLSRNNRSGFSAFPAGNRGDDGRFNYLGTDCYFWTTLENGASAAYYRYLYFNFEVFFRHYFSKSTGFSIRLVRNVN